MDLQPQVVIAAMVLPAISLGLIVGLMVSRNWSSISFFIGRAGSLLRGHPPYEIWPEAIIGLDAKGAIRYLNHAAADLFGYPESQLRGQPISCLIRGAAFQQCNQVLSTTSETFMSACGMDADGIRRGGRVFPVHCTALGPSFILVHDQSARARISELQQRADLLAAAFETNPTPLLILDDEGRVIAANRTCSVVFGGPIRRHTRLSELFPGAKLSRGMRLQHKPSGYAFTAAPDPDGCVNGNVVLLGYRNVQRRRLADLLTEVTAYSELLLLDTANDSVAREDLALIHAASREAINIVRTLADER